MKKCTKCGEEKPRSEFHRKSAKKDGLANQCKTCASEARADWYQRNRAQEIEKVAVWRANNPETVKRYQASYRKRYQKKIKRYQAQWREENKERIAEYQAAIREDEPERVLDYSLSSYVNVAKDDPRRPQRAKDVVFRAVKARKLPHISECDCADCGKQAQEYHHPDYDRPLYVVPLCRQCHKGRHNGTA